MGFFRRAFIPHARNDFQPYVLRRVALTGMAVLVGISFAAANIHVLILQHSAWLAANVIPAVVFDLTNESRMAEAHAPLRRNPVLDEAARLKAEDMAEYGYFAHESPHGATPWDWFEKAGYSYAYAGENLAVHFFDSGEVVDAWLESPGHRANIMHDRYTEIGIGTAKGTYEGFDTIFVVQMFGTPAGAPIAKATSNEQEADDMPPSFLSTVGEVLAAQEPEPILDENKDLSPVSDKPESLSSGATQPVRSANLFTRALGQPSAWLAIFYSLIAVFVFISLVLAIVIEWRRQHPVQIAYGVGMLGLLGVLFYAHTWLVSGALII